jgi:nanoRNase/pAp phosphatase (c-di-AMP/oligoRNAs hydrolase)
LAARLATNCDFALIWYYDHGDREINKVSLRAFHDTVDVSEVSKLFQGGGGHKKAAGFRLPGNFSIEDLFDK